MELGSEGLFAPCDCWVDEEVVFWGWEGLALEEAEEGMLEGGRQNSSKRSACEEEWR